MGQRRQVVIPKAVFEALRQKLGPQVQSVRADREDEVYVLISDSDIRPITAHLRGEFGARLVTVFAEDRRSVEGVFFNYYVFEQKGSAQYLIVQAPVRSDTLEFPSLSAELPAVNWQEREIQDWFGLKAVGHPNPRRVALHDNWPDVYPLRKDFPLQTVLPPFEGERHIYRPAFGEGVLQVPVGPVHAGTIEPGHFNFAVAGEPILYLQLRMFYTHKGTEKLFEKLPIHKAVFLAESISGDSSFSHGTAFCQAIERAASMEVPLRGLVMRTILLELERICNHVGDIGAIANDVGFVMANAGVDQSNVGSEDGEHVLLLPRDPDASAAALKTQLDREFGVNLGILINDSFGRAWRNGVVGVALGAAGIPALRDMAGTPDLFGREMRVTEVAVADEIAAAASLLMGQAAEGQPAVHLRGYFCDAPAAPASALLRAKALDLFR